MKRLAKKRRLRAPAPALVISLIALFIALGGTTYAATSLPMNSVGTKQIKNGSVAPEDLRSGLWGAGSTITQPKQLSGSYDVIESTTVTSKEYRWSTFVQATLQVTNNGTLPATLSLVVQRNADIQGGYVQTIPPGVTELVPAGFQWNAKAYSGKEVVLLLAKSDPSGLVLGTRNLNATVLPG